MRAIIPWNGSTVIDHTDVTASEGFGDWWAEADTLWRDHASNDVAEEDDDPRETESLLGNVDYLSKLTSQFPTSGRRVVYTKSGVTLTAALVSDTNAVIDHSLYWINATSSAEALYLLAILNSNSLLEEISGYQPVGLFGRRHFDKYVFEVPWPRYDANKQLHQSIAACAASAIESAAAVDIGGAQFQKARKIIREHLADTGIAGSIDELALDLFTTADD
jgi:hypothetical protein